jgi:hypothetical protein
MQPKNNKKHRNQRITVEDRFERYKKHRENYTPEQLDVLESYHYCIWIGIEKATRYDSLHDFEGFDERKEAFEYELLVKGSKFIIEERPPKGAIVNWTKKLTNHRKRSWYIQKARQIESIQIMDRSCVLEFDDEGEIKDSGYFISDWIPPLTPPDFSKLDPETCLIQTELSEAVKNLPSEVGESGKKWAKVYKKILQMQLDGIEVRKKHTHLLGVDKDNVANLKFQTRELARKILAVKFPGLEHKQAIYKAEKKKKRKISKSTFRQRQELKRETNSEEMKPRTIRVLKVIAGGKKDASGNLPPDRDSNVVEFPVPKKTS